VAGRMHRSETTTRPAKPRSITHQLVSINIEVDAEDKPKELPAASKSARRSMGNGPMRMLVPDWWPLRPERGKQGRPEAPESS
jgi:hypothetical protein